MMCPLAHLGDVRGCRLRKQQTRGAVSTAGGIAGDNSCGGPSGIGRWRPPAAMKKDACDNLRSQEPEGAQRRARRGMLP